MEMIKGQVRIPPNYFRDTARRPYAAMGWERALAREIEQNARDAGATWIEFKLFHKDRALIFEDDGCGMSLDIIRNKLLVMGGSHKPPGAVGGFGKAKEILFLAWERYQILTNDGTGCLEVNGVGSDYEIRKVSGEMSVTEGTWCRIFFPPDVNLSDLAGKMKIQLQLSQGKARVFWHEPDHADCSLRYDLCQLPLGQHIRELPWCDVYVARTRSGRKLDDPLCHIRLRGIHMFGRWIGNRKAQVIVEVKGDSVDAMNESRTSLSSDRNAELDRLINEIVVDPATALKPKPKATWNLIEGTGAIRVIPKLEVQEAVGRMSLGLAEMLEGGRMSAHGMVEGARAGDRWVETLARATDTDLATVAGLAGRIRWAADTLHHQIDDGRVMAGAEGDQLVKIVKVMCAEPDFVVHALARGTASHMTPPTWSPKYRLLGKMWEWVVKRVLVDAELWIDFSPGFTFVDDREAEYSKMDRNHAGMENSFHAIMLAPMRNGKPYFNKLSPGMVLGHELLELAIHEAAHVRYPEHNEEFVQEMHRIWRCCRKTMLYSIVGILKEARAEVDAASESTHPTPGGCPVIVKREDA